MGIYKNSAGVTVDEAKVGAKTAADWAAQGFTLVNAPAQASSALTNLSIGAANGTITNQSQVQTIPKTGDITTDSLKSAEPINLGISETPTTDEANAMAAGAKATTKTLADYIKELTPAPTETSKQTDDLTSQINSLSQSLVNQGSDQLAAETAQGLPTLKNDLSAVNAEIQTKTAEYDALISGVESKNIGMGNIYRQQSNIAKAKASELGILQARALGLQGQITQAQATADRAIDLKYSAIETQLKVYQAQLSALEGKLTREEEIQREARQAMLDDQKQVIAEKKEEEKNIQSIALTAIQNGADGALANAIQNAKSLTEAAQIAGQLATSSGWQYVNTPALRDSLIKQGYQITQAGGRTYAKPSEEKYTTKNITVGSGKTAKEYLITYNSLGQETKRELLSGGSSVSNKITPKTQSPTEILNSAVNDMTAQLKTVVGSDGFISPDNYTAARNAWIAEGFSPTTFDTKFKGFRNPNNPNYVTNKQKVNTNDRDV